MPKASYVNPRVWVVFYIINPGSMKESADLCGIWTQVQQAHN